MRRIRSKGFVISMQIAKIFLSLFRCITVILMLIGAFAYSFTISSLSSLLSDLDEQRQIFNEKTTTLLRLKSQYKLDSVMVNRIRKAIKYEIIK